MWGNLPQPVATHNNTSAYRSFPYYLLLSSIPRNGSDKEKGYGLFALLRVTYNAYKSNKGLSRSGSVPGTRTRTNAIYLSYVPA